MSSFHHYPVHMIAENSRTVTVTNLNPCLLLSLRIYLAISPIHSLHILLQPAGVYHGSLFYLISRDVLCSRF
jgi:hypothetical protein